MIKSGRSLRLARLLKGQDSPLLLVPMDHTVTDGPFGDARHYDTLQTILADNGADAIVVHKGRLALLNGNVYANLSVVVHVSASTKYATDPNFKYQVGDAEECLRRGADAVSVHVNLGSATEDQQIRAMASMADSCDRVGLPLLAMIYPRGQGIKNHTVTDTLRHAASLAVDLGADIVKLPLSGSISEMQRVIDWCPIPVLAAGGSQVSDQAFTAFAGDAMRAGARGLAAGRNIFLAPDPAKKVRDIRKTLDDNFMAIAPETPLAVVSTG
jgi:2-amino-4,5-dihydroxy-6-oxo-7-(phosphooxy)heptanoate synthase